MNIDLGVIFFDFPPSGCGGAPRLSSDSHAASHVKWSGLLSSGFEVMGSPLQAVVASSKHQQHSSTVRVVTVRLRTAIVPGILVQLATFATLLDVVAVTVDLRFPAEP